MSKTKPFYRGVFELSGHKKTEAGNKVSEIFLTFKTPYNYEEFIEILKLDGQIVRVVMKHENQPESQEFRGAKVDAVFGLKLSKTHTKNEQTVIILDQEYKYTTLVEIMKFNEFDVKLDIYIIQENLDMETATEEEDIPL